MAQTTIEWTARRRLDGTMAPGYTFNPWRGCTKVSQGCKFCYADAMSGRNPKTLGVWGPRGTRPTASESYWKQPIAWDREAAAMGERRAVFCSSLADVFEGDDTMPAEYRLTIRDARQRLWELIEQTDNLDWLLLTKRPENVLDLLWSDWLYEHVGIPDNVWIGTSVEDQATADERIPHLLKVPAKVRFLSCEPLLGAVDLSAWLNDRVPLLGFVHTIDWVIAGGESGPNARPMHPQWARSLRDQAQAAGVAYFFKQWGEFEPYEQDGQAPFWRDTNGNLHDGHGLNILDPRTCDIGKGWHESSLDSEVAFRRVGKHAAGRLLDGRTWDELPAVAVKG